MQIDQQQIAKGTTSQFAQINGIKPETALKQHCLTGSYYGVIPKKRPNGHLVWPLVEAGEYSNTEKSNGEK